MALFSAQIFQKMTKSEFLIVIYADLFRWSFPKSLWILMEFLVIGNYNDELIRYLVWRI